MTNQTASLESKIKSAAQQLGFCLTGLTTPESPHTFETYRRWINAGRHAGMSYLSTDRALARRKDPRQILPNCETILITATPYLPHGRAASETVAEARIASYALGDDYHDVIIDRLEQLVRLIEALVGYPIANKIYTDTGPVMERDLAQRAGLGWIGKNTCLINPEHGSYFLLGELLLEIPLQPDRPFDTDRCGTCTRCIEACPTKCILPDRTIDSNRCISYLTIEEKGAIDQKLRRGVGNWLFGCDICQEVCPWNVRFAQTTSDTAFQPRAILEQPGLCELLALKPGSWLKSLRGSPLERPRRRGLVRNSAIVAGNSGDAKYLDELIQLLTSDPEPLVRQHAAWAIGCLNTSRGRRALQTALGTERDPEVSIEIREALQAGDVPDR